VSTNATINKINMKIERRRKREKEEEEEEQRKKEKEKEKENCVQSMRPKVPVTQSQPS
jgi:hypothetical protein